MYKNASDDMEPCESLLMCERSNLSMKLDRVLHELRTDNEALRSQLTENEKARKTEYEALGENRNRFVLFFQLNWKNRTNLLRFSPITSTAYVLL